MARFLTGAASQVVIAINFYNRWMTSDDDITPVVQGQPVLTFLSDFSLSNPE